ncbi:hypothetical protein [Pseudoponticoccus marisrubri]|uniref:Uncharacterized protein n=1 Tax=Pseudoponticoccus marisrubri TaxID=1685382 RepID=A0A0W7WJ84_9RHOB|nr:hypothetical protein [Pseudoponticoccus marisrubri]KUF10617.1 hypothetical protein AVJ23_12145 [Pseudoponticoccus marisrubri]
MRSLALLLALLASGPAHALSCIGGDIASAFLSADESPDPWVVIDGRLSFDAALLPKGTFDEGAEAAGPTEIPARIAGRSLGREGFKQPFDQPVTLRVSCAGPWCGSATDAARYVAFLKRTAEGYMAFAGPCGGHLFQAPTEEQKQIVVTCFNGGPCQPAEF